MKSRRSTVHENNSLEHGKMNNLQNEIGSLSATEKFELLDVLWESLEADAPPLTDAQRAELDYRMAQYERNPSDVIPWEDVRARLFKNQ
jgi:putative addiction module component (TIGR02574 family)